MPYRPQHSLRLPGPHRRHRAPPRCAPAHVYAVDVSQRAVVGLAEPPADSRSHPWPRRFDLRPPMSTSSTTPNRCVFVGPIGRGGRGTLADTFEPGRSPFPLSSSKPRRPAPPRDCPRPAATVTLWARGRPRSASYGGADAQDIHHRDRLPSPERPDAVPRLAHGLATAAARAPSGISIAPASAQALFDSAHEGAPPSELHREHRRRRAPSCSSSSGETRASAQLRTLCCPAGSIRTAQERGAYAAHELVAGVQPCRPRPGEAGGVLGRAGSAHGGWVGAGWWVGAGDDLVMERLPLRGVLAELSDAISLATLALWLQG